MILSEIHIIKLQNKYYDDLDNLCFLSKNLYNVGLYNVRQHYFDEKKYLNYNDINKNFVENNQVDYRNLPAKVSQQTLKLLDKNFISFFKLLKKKDYNKQKNIPKYLPKNGRNIIIYTKQAISKKRLKDGYIKLSGTDVELNTKTNYKNIQQVRVIHKGNHIKIEVLYKVQEKKLKENNDRYCSIDLGLNNLCLVGSNVIKPIIINGKPLKSINQFYNKKISNLKSILETVNKIKTSKRIKSTTLKRNNKISDYLHKSSKIIINHLVSNHINTLIIGKNDGWKQEINIGKKNNQNFVQVPFNNLIHMLKYKCELEGIKFIDREESYTSKASFLDNDVIPTFNKSIPSPKFSGKRIKRGLYKTKENKIINADLNGALNILRKEIGKFQYPIEVCSTPLVYSINY